VIECGPKGPEPRWTTAVRRHIVVMKKFLPEVVELNVRAVLFLPSYSISNITPFPPLFPYYIILFRSLWGKHRQTNIRNLWNRPRRHRVENRTGREETSTGARPPVVVCTMTRTMRDHLVWTDRVSVSLGQKAVVRRTRPPGLECIATLTGKTTKKKTKQRSI
jgi:hypothetical protein